MTKSVEVIKNKENVLIKTSHGEYHFSKEDYKALGKQKAIKYAESEIEKKNTGGQYSKISINYKQATELGFCQYGIKEFAKMLDLNIEETYTIDDLNRRLTLEALKSFPNECLKLFGANCIKYLGTVKELISVDTIDLFLREEFIKPRILHKLSVKFAYSCLPNYENEYPGDNRVRHAIETKERWIEEKIRIGEL